jgi:RNA-binding protein YhbY
MNIQDENSVTIQLGKKGLSETFYLEIIKGLKQNKLVKVKILKNAMEASDKDTYTQTIIDNIILKLDIEYKLVGKTLFLKKKKAVQKVNNIPVQEISEETI